MNIPAEQNHQSSYFALISRSNFLDKVATDIHFNKTEKRSRQILYIKNVALIPNSTSNYV